MLTSIGKQHKTVKHLAVAAMMNACMAVASTILIPKALADGQQLEYGIESAGKDWWTTNPTQSSSGSVITHPQWVLDALDEKPVLIHVHKGCSYCRPQTEAMAEVVREYKEELLCYNISAEGVIPEPCRQFQPTIPKAVSPTCRLQL